MLGYNQITELTKVSHLSTRDTIVFLRNHRGESKRDSNLTLIPSKRSTRTRKNIREITKNCLIICSRNFFSFFFGGGGYNQIHGLTNLLNSLNILWVT